MKKKVRKVRTNLHQTSQMMMLLHHVPGVMTESVKENVVTWSEKKTNVNFPHYNEMPGPTVTLDADKVELDFFALMFNLDLCVWIAAETNRYAEQLQWQKGMRHEMEANYK